MKKQLKPLCPVGTKKYDKVLMALAFLFAFFFMSHPDLWETANHSYVFLESIADGKFLDFYAYCAAHNNTYYYINAANYNIVIYIIFGLWELPVFLFNRIFHLAMNEVFLIYWAKIVSAGFFVGCGYHLRNLCVEISLSEENACLAGLFFLFNPVAFFSPMAMGQYDSLCLFFVLWALCHYAKGDMKKFSVIMGVGIVCKFFPMLILIPLVLLTEKRIVDIVKYILLSMWLYIPTTLMYFGRTGNASAFTKRMMERMFAITVDTPFSKMSVFVCLYAMLLFVCFVYCPKEYNRKYMAVYLPMVVFGALMCCILWHPQWVLMMMPFIVATTFCQKNKTVWFCLDLVLCAGFFTICYAYFGFQRCAYLFEGGLLRHAMHIGVSGRPAYMPIIHFIQLIPYSMTVMPVMFRAPVGLNIILKMPVGSESLADKISKPGAYDQLPVKMWGYAIFIIGFGCMWVCPAAIELLNALGII